MRTQVLLALFLAAGFAAFGQTAPAPPQGLPKDPSAIFAAAAPYYDFSDPTLKPWHLKATYQLYDDKGKPSEQGTYEYWWASPKVYRSTWTRPGATHTDWYTADGKHASQATGEPLRFFEYKLQTTLLSPLPDSVDLDTAHFRLYKADKKFGNVKLPCIMAIPLTSQQGQAQTVQLGMFPTYCFDPQQPVLRGEFSFGTIGIVYNKIAMMQGKYLALGIECFDEGRKVFSATVDTVNGLAPSDAALTPPASAPTTKIGKVSVAAGMAVGMLVNKVFPLYPKDAKDAHASGRVILQGTIGTDGRVHDLRVVEAPWPSLAASALWAVSQWQYKPYMLNGEPVEVETTINVIFTLGN